MSTSSICDLSRDICALVIEPTSPKCLINAQTVQVESRPTPLLWSRGVARWLRRSLSVADSFVCRCLTSSAVLPFPHPTHRTGRADLPHPALGEDSRTAE